MSCRSLILSIIIILASVQGKSQRLDSIFFFKGQLLVGQIRDGSLGRITIDDEDLGYVSVKLIKVKTISSNQRFKIQLSDKTIVFGILTPSPKDGWAIIMQDDETSLEVEINSINDISALQKSFIQRLTGNFSLGFSYTKASDLGQITLGSAIRYTSDKFENQLTVSTISSIDSNEFTRDREDVTLFPSYLLDESWFVTAGFAYQRNLQLGIARRLQQLVGGGNKFVVKRYWQMLGLTGITFNQEKNTNGESSGLLMEIPFAVQFNFFKYSKPNMQITTGQSAFVSLTQKGRFRFDSKTTFAWQLIDDFWLNFNPYTSYDSQPPQGSNNFDYGVSLSVSYKF